MALIQAKLTDQNFAPIQADRISQKNSDAVSIEGVDRTPAIWIDLEEVLSEEWEIGGPAMTPETLRALLAGE